MGRVAKASAVAAALLSFVPTIVAQGAQASSGGSGSSDIPSCGPGKKCPSDSPCCSQYGQCGVGAYCLGGCDPLFSFDFKSCVPAAVCKDSDYKLENLDDVESIDKYLGDYSSTNWVASGTPKAYNSGGNNGILLTMAQDTVGTLMATTHYVWYGSVSATMTTSQGAGVVTAFILMSDVKDEIDFEFVGVDIHNAQSNFYSQGVTNYNNEKNLTVSGDTVSKAHTYTVDWKPDTLTWAVDGTVLRTLKRSDTWNATANRFDYPQTPARIMLSLWPAGLPTNGKGTIEWSGGNIDWSSPYMSDGYYYALVNEVNVKCYDPPSGISSSGSKSYVYTGSAGTNNTVEITDDVTVLKSIYADGDNPNTCPDCAASSSGGSKPTSASKPSKTPQTVPGEVGGGGRGDDAASAAGSSPSGTSGGSGGSGSSGGDSSSGGGDTSSFSQGTDSNSNSNGGTGQSTGVASGLESKMAGGSALAVFVALAATMFL